MTFSIKEDCFYLNNKKVFLNSGEIHYFRIKRELWDKHLQAACDAGLTTVSTYVPWAWHESTEGVFDFDGISCPERDLNAWLQLCKEYNLHCILKPGPFILAETRGAGLPDWFLHQHQNEVKMHNRKGDIVQSDGVSLFNKIYLEKVTLWYDQIMPFIREREISNGGPVIMIQICNEIGVFPWLAHQGDYSKDVNVRFISYLKNKFSNITEVNRLWGKSYNQFDDIVLPPDGKLPYESKEDRARDYEWHCFWRTYYGDYLRMLCNMARERGVTVPFYHNLPGWIYGSGYEFPVNITMYENLYQEKSELIFGVDHIPEFMSYRNMHDDRIINDITFAMQGKKPLFAAEFQSGSREYHVVPNPREMELFYKASIANGLSGWNYYMFSQGHNQRQKGYSGDTFYWYCPLTPEGKRTSAFPLVKRMSKIIKTSEHIILNAKRKAEVCVLFYPPYYATELERPENGKSELEFTPATIRRTAYFDGLLKALQVLNIDYDMLDLSKASVDKLTKYKQVWAFTTDEMNAKDQQVIVDYTKAGGNLIMFPYLPDREMNQNPCSIIRKALSIEPMGKEIIDSPLVDIYNLKDIKCANPQIVYSKESLLGAKVIAKTINDTICGFEKNLGKGLFINIGTWFGFDTEGHRAVYETILNKSDAKLRQSFVDNENIAVRQRFTDDDSAILFIGNYYNEESWGKISYTHPQSGELVTIPYAQEKMLFPPLYAMLTPICIDVIDGLKILHSTSDIISIEVLDDKFNIIVYGDRDLIGEIVLEGINTTKVKSATIDGENINIICHKNRIVLNYNHKHKKEMFLTVKIC
ncbi:MAG: beta-galactosidase [Bacteroidetes bacterium]|nr:beta-galactosidase [Bacteroidota bacterium]